MTEVTDRRLAEKVLKRQFIQKEKGGWRGRLCCHKHDSILNVYSPANTYKYKVELDCMKAAQQYANDKMLMLTENDYFVCDWASGRVSFIYLPLSLSLCLIVIAR